MKIFFKITFFFQLVLLSFFYQLHGQSSLYVSKQTLQFTKFEGDSSKTTDRYEHGSVVIGLVPSSSCPITYTLTPSDFSINVNQTKSWEGEVKPDLSYIPTPGTSANASLKGDYDVYYSRPEGGSGGSIVGGYDCGVCYAHPTGGHHDIIHKTGTIIKNFIVYSVNVDIPDSITCKDGIASLKATYYPQGGTLEWTTPTGTLIGNNLSYTIPSPLTNDVISVKYTISGVSYSDTGYIRIARLTGFEIPCCTDTTKLIKDIDTLTFDGVCEPHIKYTPAQVSPPLSPAYKWTYIVTAYDSVNNINIVDTIVAINKNQAISGSPLGFDLSKVGDMIKNVMEALDNGGVSPCTWGGNWIPSVSITKSIFKICCPNNGCDTISKKITGGATWSVSADCHIPVFGCPYVASFDLVLVGSFSLDVNVSGETTCTNYSICINATPSYSIGGGVGFTLLAGFVSGNLSFVITGCSSNISYCFEPPPASGTYTSTIGAASIVGTVTELWGLVTHSVNYPLWAGWNTPTVNFP